MARNVLVTGASGGMGRAVAARFAANGDAVVITGRDAERLRRAADEIGASGVVCDAADPEQVASLRAGLGDTLDVLVNNAGGNTDFDSGGAAAESAAAGPEESAAARTAAARPWNGWRRAGARTSTRTSSVRCSLRTRSPTCLPPADR